LDERAGKKQASASGCLGLAVLVPAGAAGLATERLVLERSQIVALYFLPDSIAFAE